MFEPTDNVLRDKVAGWLDTQGYPLEMEVASHFRKRGFRAGQSEYYEDRETGESREIDVVALSQKEIDGCLFRITFCVECKVTTDKPWVLLTSEDVRLAGPARVAQRAASQLGSRFLRKICHDSSYQGLNLMQLPNRPAFGVTQAFTSGKDVAFNACMATSKAVAGTISEADEVNNLAGPFLNVVFPVVVIDGRLFESYLDDSGKAEVEEVAGGVLVWRNKVVQMPHTIIHIVTLPNLGEFVGNAQSAVDLFLGSEQAVSEFVDEQGIRFAAQSRQERRRNSGQTIP